MAEKRLTTPSMAAGKHVDPADDEHVVEPAEDAALEAPEGASAPANSSASAHVIPGPVADDRRTDPAQVCQDKLSVRPSASP